MTKKFMNTKTMTITALSALTLIFNVGMAAAATTPSTTPATTNQATTGDHPMLAGVIAKYHELLNKGQLPQAITYLNANIKSMTKPQATILVLELENAMNKQLPAVQKRLEADKIQQAIGKVYKQGDSLDKLIASTKDTSLKALLVEVRDSGYKLETSEGMFYPVVNYTVFKKYQPNVNEDIVGYINIMDVESTEASLKDNTLAIGYQQLVNRVITQESFLSKFPKSNRAPQVKALFANYNILTFYGSNNSPLFDYDSQIMQPNAKKAYLAILGSITPGTSPYLNNLQKFMTVLKDSNYKLTAEVTKFRKTNVPIN